MQTMRDQIISRIERGGAGRAFTPKDFLDIASRGTIDMALTSLTRSGTIRRVGRGLYDMPKVNPALGGKLSPDIDETARALARKQRWKIVPEGVDIIFDCASGETLRQSLSTLKPTGKLVSILNRGENI